MSPIYRGLTIQFKVYVSYLPTRIYLTKTFRFLQMSGMVMGAMLEADHRLRAYEAKVRMEKRMMRDRAIWDQYEQQYDQPPKQERCQ